MNKSYDAYMCRESEKEKAAFIWKRSEQLAGLLNLKVIKESDVEGMLEHAWVDYLRDKAETERQLPDKVLKVSIDDLWTCWSSKVASHGFLMVDADGKLVRSKGGAS